MGLLSGRHNDTTTTTTGHHGHNKHHGHTTASNGVGQTRYSTRSRGPLGGSGPGMTTGSTNTSGGGLFSSKKNRNAVGSNNNGGGMFSGNNANTTNTTGGGMMSGNGQPVAGAAPVNNPSAGHASSTVTAGKLQEGVGKVFHSRSMQTKGAAKVQKGEQERLSVGHLQEADRLENEAVMRRGMAGVGQGTHTTAGNMRGGLRH